MHPSSATPARSSIPPRPQLKPWYRVAESGDALVLEHAQTALVFEGRAARELLPALLPLLDGTRTVQQVVEELAPSAGSGVGRALRILAERGLLLDGPPPQRAASPGASETTRLLASLSPVSALSSVDDALAGARVELVGAGDAVSAVASLLRDSGASGVCEESWADAGETGSDLTVVVPARDEVSEIEDWNRRAVIADRVWLQVLPFDGRFAAIGPLYVPGETCCFECYRLRRRSTSGYAEEFGAVEAVPVAAPGGPALVAGVSGIAAAVALRWLAHRDQRLPGVLHAYERGGTAITAHRVYRVPRCPVCSAAAAAAPPLPWYKETRAPMAEAS